MDPVLDEFHKDLDRLDRLLGMLETLKSFAGTSISSAAEASDPILQAAKDMHRQAQACHTDTIVLTGTILLYLAGRFEYFVRTNFEDLCSRVATSVGAFSRLPPKMRENLISYTAEVMASPRKYGHGEQGVYSFVAVLAQNLDDTRPLSQINSVCLSITTQNMRAPALTELFERIGAKDIWKRIAQQATVMHFFETAQVDQTQSKAMSYLNEFMELRNRVAHPSPSFSWPSPQRVILDVKFFRVLSEAINAVIPVVQLELTQGRMAAAVATVTSAASANGTATSSGGITG